MFPLLFSMDGRINRARFWFAGLASSIVLTVVLALVLVGLWAIIPGEVDADGGYTVNGVTALPYIAVGLAYTVLVIWSGLCLGVKRYHDLDKSGVWVLVMLIPVVGGLIYFIQAGCLRGTAGANRYGADPLAA